MVLPFVLSSSGSYILDLCGFTGYVGMSAVNPGKAWQATFFRSQIVITENKNHSLPVKVLRQDFLFPSVTGPLKILVRK